MSSKLSLTKKKKTKKKTKKKETKKIWCWFDHWFKAIELAKMKLIWWRSEFSIENEMLIWSLSLRLSNWRRRKRKSKKWCDNWSIKLSLENSSNVETLVWCVFIQYIRFAVVVSSYSFLNTNIENQTSRSISFYSWKRHLTLTEILNSFEHYWHEWWSTSKSTRSITRMIQQRWRCNTKKEN